MTLTSSAGVQEASATRRDVEPRQGPSSPALVKVGPGQGRARAARPQEFAARLERVRDQQRNRKGRRSLLRHRAHHEGWFSRVRLLPAYAGQRPCIRVRCCGLGRRNIRCSRARLWRCRQARSSGTRIPGAGRARPGDEARTRCHPDHVGSDQLDPDNRVGPTEALTRSPEPEATAGQVREFATMLTHRRRRRLEAWITATTAGPTQTWRASPTGCAATSLP